MMRTAGESDVPIACNLGALSTEERARRADLAARVHAATRAVSELSNGFALELNADAAACREALEFCLLERRCCPFLEFELRFEPAEGPVSLRLTGRPGVKEFLASEAALGRAGAPRGTCG